MPTKGKRKGKSAWNIKFQGSEVVGWACPETVGLYNIDFMGRESDSYLVDQSQVLLKTGGVTWTFSTSQNKHPPVSNSCAPPLSSQEEMNLQKHTPSPLAWYKTCLEKQRHLETSTCLEGCVKLLRP